MKTSRSFSTILVFTCLSLIGLALLPLLSVKLSPSRDLPQININFQMYGSSSRIVEMEATSKLEAMLSRMKNVEETWSNSGNGWGAIGIRLDKHADINAARFEASTIIRQAWPQLPKEVSYPSITMSQSDDKANIPFMTFTVNAPANPIVIQEFSEKHIKSKLSQIPGVDRIDIHGANPMQWELIYDCDRLNVLKVQIGDIQNAINQYFNKEFLGIVSFEEVGKGVQWIRLALLPPAMEGWNLDVSRIRVTNQDGKIISLDQLVQVRHLEEEARSYYRINGLNSIYLSISSNEHANQLNLSRKIQETMGQMKALFPAGYEIHLNYDATEYIHAELNKIYFRSGLTLLILLLFVLIVYRNWKYLLLITASLIANLAIAVIGYYLLHLDIQLFSLTGITISLTLVIDNIIIMSDQILNRRNMKAFLAILTASLTTISSLFIIFFMDEKIRLNLQDFAWVIMVNLAVSLFVVLFFVPAVMDRLKIRSRKRVQFAWIKKGSGKLRVVFHGKFRNFFRPGAGCRLYAAYCRFGYRFRPFFVLFIVLAFGLPIFLLPDKLEGEGKWVKMYNQTIGSDFYKEKIKPYADKYLGGSLRLFGQHVFEGSYFTQKEETRIYVTATLPNGATVSQMNNLIQKMERYISQFREVKQFQTRIENARNANISIQFTKESELTNFPFILKSNLINKSLELGGGSWSVYGLGDGFSNDVSETAGNFRVEMYGFNYDELNEWAEKFKARLLEYRRIKEVNINSEFSWYKDDYREFNFKINPEELAKENIQPVQLFHSLSTLFAKNNVVRQVPGENGLENVVLTSQQSSDYDIWRLRHSAEKAGERTYKLSNVADIEKYQAPQQIAKVNQQYRLCLQYDYIGSTEQGEKVLNRLVDSFKKQLPLGYSVANVQGKYWWGEKNKQQYALLLLIFVIIYFTTSILFNSLKQPLFILFVIPISYIGVFLTFYLFGLNFDQGGFASFVLLCGISVNANVYVLSEYNNIRNQFPNRKPLEVYIRAFRYKIVPILLTIISTILGFIPFLIGESKEAFWFPLAAGTIGGLIVSILGLVFYLPLFMAVGKNK